MCKSIIYVPLIELVLLALWYYFAADVYMYIMSRFHLILQVLKILFELGISLKGIFLFPRTVPIYDS